MFFRNFSLALVFVFAFFMLGFVFPALIADCRDVNSDVFGVTNTLTGNINGWVGTCFPLQEAADNNSFELDCDNFSIDTNSDSNYLFDTRTFDIDTIILRNCDINLFGPPVSGIHVNSDVNFITITDSNIYSNSEAIFKSVGAVDTNIDLNFSGAGIYVSGLAEGFLFDTTSSYNSVIVRNLQTSGGAPILFDMNSEITDFYLLNSTITDTSATTFRFDLPPNNLYFTGTTFSFTGIAFNFQTGTLSNILFSDLNVSSTAGTLVSITNFDFNNITFLDSNLALGAASTFYYFNSAATDNFVSFDFNNVDANYLVFSEVTDLNISSFTSADSFIQINSGSDINFVYARANSFVQNAGNFLLANGVTDPELTVDFGDSNFNLTNTRLLYFLSSDINAINITDVNAVSVGSSSRLFETYSSDINFIDLSSSTIDYNDGYLFYIDTLSGSSLDLDLAGNVWSLTGGETSFYLDTLTLDSLTISDFDVTDSSTSTAFVFNNLNLGQLNLFDSTILQTNSKNLFFFTNTDSDLDLNFLGSDFNINAVATFFFYVSSSSGSFAITDLNVLSFLGGRFFNTLNSDLNSISVLNSSLVFSNNISLNFTHTGADDNLSFDFSNTDADRLLFEDLNLNLTSLGAGNFFITVSDNSDLNYIAFTGANTIDINSTHFFNLQSTADSYLNFDFTNASIDVEDGLRFFSFTDSNLDTLETSDLNIPSSLNYEYYYISNSDLNTINLFDSNIPTAGSANFVQLIGTTDSSIDFNFSGTTLDINVNAGGAGFYFSNSNYDSFSISDLTDLTYTDSGSAFLKVLATSDVNTFTLLNSAFDISSGSTFYDAGVQDTLLSFDFNNTDANYLQFNDLNVNLTTIGNNFFKIDTDSNLNYVVFSGNTQIDMNNGNMLLFTGNTNYDTIDFNFGDFPINLTGNSTGFRFSDGNYNSISINNLNLNSSSGVAVIKDDSNIADLSFLYSDIVVTSTRFFDRSTVCMGPCGDPMILSSLDLNFFGSDINVSGAGVLPFYLANTIYTGNFNISNLKLNASDNYSLTMSDVNIASLNVTDSNFYLDQFATLGDSYVLDGAIYNNKFIDTNTANNFISVTTSSFGADFNIALNEDNYAKRVLWLDDDSNATGGNLWVNSSGTNLCNTDLVSPFGICDSAFNILGDDVNYSDNLPLRDYDPQDLNVTNIDFNAEPIVYGESVDINATIFNNSSDGATDINFFVEYYIGGVLDANYELDDVLASGASLVNTHTWDSNIAGDVNVYVCVNYQLDTNTLNDCNQTILTVLIADLNVVADVDDVDANVNYGDDVNIQVTYGNEGDANATANYTLTYYINNTQYASYTISDNLNVSDIDINSLLWDSNIVGDVNIFVVIDYSGDDNDATNDSNYQSLWVRVVDLNAFDIDVNDDSIVLGDVVDINVDYINSGDANADANYYVLYYIEGNLDENYLITEDLSAGGTDTNNYVWTSDILGSVDVNVCLDYTGYDDNANNDCTQTTLTVADVPSPPGGGKKIENNYKVKLESDGTLENGLTLIGKVTETIGNQDFPDSGFDYTLYVVTDSSKEEILNKSFEEEKDFKEDILKTITFSDLLKIDDIMNLVDNSGYVTFLAEIDVSDTEDSDNNDSVTAKVEYFSSKITDVYFLDGSEQISVKLDATVNLDVEKTYNLFVVFNTKAINKSKSVNLKMTNKSEGKTVINWVGSLGGNTQVKETDTTYSEKINLISLMPHNKEKIKNLIFEVLDLNKLDSDDTAKVEEIIDKLSDEFQSSETDNMEEYYSDEDYILFGSEIEEILLKYSEEVTDFTFDIEFASESEEDESIPGNPGNPGDKGSDKGSTTGSTGSGFEASENYFVNFKKKLGLEEVQEFTILNAEKLPVANLPMIVYFEDKNWQFKADAKGKVLFTPEFEGKYSFGVPYPDEKVKGTFDVIEGYVSSDSDFVEESGNFFGSWSDVAKKSFLAVIIVVVLIVLFVLYKLLRPKKKYGLESLSE